MQKNAQELDFQAHAEFNRAKATGHFAARFDRSCGVHVARGTLPRSHLCLAPRVIVAGAAWPAFEGMESTADERARLNPVLD